MLYDAYANYRNTALTEQESAHLNSATFISQHGTQRGAFPPVTKAHMDIALARAEKQLSVNAAMPEDESISIRFPGIDPVGKFSAMDMQFAYREAHIAANLATKDSATQAHYAAVRQQVLATPQAQALEKEMRLVCARHRRYSRAAKLCLEEDGAQALHEQARALEESPCLAQYSQLLSGMELLAGLTPKEDTLQVKSFFQAQFQTTLGTQRLDCIADNWAPPSTLDVHFPDFDNQLLQSQFANPHNWGKPLSELGGDDLVDLDTVSQSIPPYCSETVGRTLSPFFQRHENSQFPFQKMLIVDGMTIQERMAKDGMDATTPAQVQSFATHCVAEALMTGRRVEAFTMNSQGYINREPMAITKSGFTPKPLEPVKLNAWQRYFNRHGGHFAAKAEKEKEYLQTVAARERVAKTAGAFLRTTPTSTHQIPLEAMLAQTAPRVEAMEKSMERLHQTQALQKNAFFSGEPIPAPEAGSALRTSRTQAESFCVGQLAAQGHSLEDIANPQRLQEEKHAMGQHYLTLLQENNQAQYCTEMYTGLQSLNQKLSLALLKLDMANEATFLKTCTATAAACTAAFDLGQELGTAAAEAAMTGVHDLAAVTQEVEQACRTAMPMTMIVNGYCSEINLAAKGNCYTSGSDLALELGHAAVGQQLRTQWGEELQATGKVDTLDYNALGMCDAVVSNADALETFCDRLLQKPDALKATRLCALQGQLDKALDLEMNFKQSQNEFVAAASIKPTIEIQLATRDAPKREAPKKAEPKKEAPKLKGPRK